MKRSIYGGAMAENLDPGDIAAVVAEINRRTGSGLELVGVADDGDTGGAVYVRWPDGRDAVVTRTSTSIVTMRQTAEILTLAKSHGLPVPRHDLTIELSNGAVAIVQERLPGSPPQRVDADVIDAMVEMNDRFAGLLTDRRDVPVVPMYLRHSGPIYPRHEVLAEHGDRSRRLLDRIREVGDSEPSEMSGDDLVHPDYSFGNVLYDEGGNVSGVVDWNWGAARGDRHFALLRIYVALYWSTLGDGGGKYGVQRSAFDRLDHVVADRIEPAVLRMYWAHITLNQLHFAIQYYSPDAIDLFQRFGESRLYG